MIAFFARAFSIPLSQQKYGTGCMDIKIVGTENRTIVVILFDR